jgi:hypothetical protein
MLQIALHISLVDSGSTPTTDIANYERTVQWARVGRLLWYVHT